MVPDKGHTTLTGKPCSNNLANPDLRGIPRARVVGIAFGWLPMDDHRRAVIAAAAKKFGTQLLTYHELVVFMREHDVTPVSQPTTRMWVRRKWLPAPLQLDSRIIAWRRDELVAWVKTREKAEPLRAYFVSKPKIAKAKVAA